MTNMKLKTVGPPPKPDWDNYSQKPRLTERQKAKIADRYEKEIAKGRNREEVLEELAEKAGRSTREIERYVSSATEKRKVEPNILLARQQHWNDLAKMAEKAANLLLGPSYGPFFGLFSHRSKERKAIQSETELPSIGQWLADTIEIPLPFDRTSQFECDLWRCLMAHLGKEFKSLEENFEDWQRHSNWLHTWQIAGDEYESRLPHKPSEVEDRQRDLTKELRQVLNLVAERRTFKGSCDICKDW